MIELISLTQQRRETSNQSIPISSISLKLPSDSKLDSYVLSGLVGGVSGFILSTLKMPLNFFGSSLFLSKGIGIGMALSAFGGAAINICDPHQSISQLPKKIWNLFRSTALGFAAATFAIVPVYHFHAYLTSIEEIVILGLLTSLCCFSLFGTLGMEQKKYLGD